VDNFISRLCRLSAFIDDGEIDICREIATSLYCFYFAQDGVLDELHCTIVPSDGWLQLPPSRSRRNIVGNISSSR
jgi:hypothetical protein